ncbi:MAG: DUF4013 domain-containing protein [bacterium]|nr:DUF4013 domain-containing protein [bacterium]
MNLGQAFRYVFNDREWVTKLGILVLVTFASLAFLPLFVGLFPLAVLLGYMLDIATNVRDDERTILPTWNNWSDQLTRGAGVLVAVMVYNLPLILLSCCLLIPGTSNLIFGQIFSIVLLCCALPFTLVYIGVTWPMLAAGTARYLRTGQTSSFFRFADLWNTVIGVGNASLQYLICTLIVMLFFFLFIFTCIGTVVVLGLLIPVQGHLLGQYALEVRKRDRRLGVPG